MSTAETHDRGLRIELNLCSGLSICRLCLTTSETMTDIFSDKQLVEKIIICTSVYLTPANGITSSICEACKQSILDMSTFRERCIQCEKFLQAKLSEQKANAKKALADHDRHDANKVCVALNVKEELLWEDQDNGEGLIETKIEIDTESIFFEDQQINIDETDKSMQDLSALNDANNFQDGSLNDSINLQSFIVKRAGSDNPGDKEFVRSLRPKRSYSLAVNTTGKQCETNLIDTTKKRSKKKSVVKKLQKNDTPTESAGSLTCTTCGKNFKNLYNLQWHSSGCKGDICKMCKERCKDKTQLNYHIKKAHQSFIKDILSKSKTIDIKKYIALIDNKEHFNCPFCTKVFKLETSFYAHINSHIGARPFKCKLCSKSFSGYYTLNSHMTDKHKGERTKEVKTNFEEINLNERVLYIDGEKHYKCVFCCKLFSPEAEFRKHMQKHVSCTLHKCEKCNKSWINKRAFEVHMKNRHDPLKPFGCETCVEIFATKEELTQHSLKHKNLKLNFQCVFCQKWLKSKKCLTEHIRSHTGEKPFQCTVCCKKFVTKSTLKSHARTVHDKTLDEVMSIPK